MIYDLSFSPSHPMSILEISSLNRELLAFLSETKNLYLNELTIRWNIYNLTLSRDSHTQSFQSVFLFHYLYSVFFPSLLHPKGPFSSSNGCVGSPPHLDIFDMKPVEEAVKSATPFINSSFSSKQTVELFSGKKHKPHVIYLQLEIIMLIKWAMESSCGLGQSSLFINKWK